MYLVTHHMMQGGKHSVSRAMAGVELCLGIGIRQSEYRAQNETYIKERGRKYVEPLYL